MKFQIESIDPKYGENYQKGYIGFTYYNKSIVSNGIAYFTRWARMSDIKVSHALIVTGKDTCVEAKIGDGVVQSDLNTYFVDPGCQIFFRKPIDINADIAKILVDAANGEIGAKYDIPLIASQAASGSFIGKLINRLFNGAPEKIISKLLNRDDRWICSELAAYCMEKYDGYLDKGILKHPSETIDPQELFEDPDIFEPWKDNLQ